MRHFCYSKPLRPGDLSIQVVSVTVITHVAKFDHKDQKPFLFILSNGLNR